MTEPANPNFRHKVPADLRAIINADEQLSSQWKLLTALGRNEWICWMTSPKTDATRAKRLGRLADEVRAGKKRPCCWPGCPHRRESARKWQQP